MIQYTILHHLSFDNYADEKNCIINLKTQHVPNSKLICQRNSLRENNWLDMVRLQNFSCLICPYAWLFIVHINLLMSNGPSVGNWMYLALLVNCGTLHADTCAWLCCVIRAEYSLANTSPEPLLWPQLCVAKFWCDVTVAEDHSIICFIHILVRLIALWLMGFCGFARKLTYDHRKPLARFRMLLTSSLIHTKMFSFLLNHFN